MQESPVAAPKNFDALTRPSGAFAMLAIDQRESMRAMFGEYQKTPVTDAQLTDFKLAALRALTPLASAVLIDRQFAWRQAIDQAAVAPACGLIAAADEFIPGADEIVADVRIDEAVQPSAVKADGAVALKLLVLWRTSAPICTRRKCRCTEKAASGQCARPAHA
jgi:sulfofructosephosphate aldolase